uniref:Uncharacterized protein n=1 Tax=Quercus lobata TaxID=97700 RepID=A0A7N2M8W2_QUELO
MLRWIAGLGLLSKLIGERVELRGSAFEVENAKSGRHWAGLRSALGSEEWSALGWASIGDRRWAARSGQCRAGLRSAIGAEEWSTLGWASIGDRHWVARSGRRWDGLRSTIGAGLWSNGLSREEWSQTEESSDDNEGPEISKWESIIWLLIMTAWISILSEYLVHAIEGASIAWNLPLEFVSVVLP